MFGSSNASSVGPHLWCATYAARAIASITSSRAIRSMSVMGHHLQNRLDDRRKRKPRGSPTFGPSVVRFQSIASASGHAGDKFDVLTVDREALANTAVNCRLAAFNALPNHSGLKAIDE
jgi:hypothetical protein